MATLEDGNGAGRSSDPMGMWAWALQYGYAAYFEVNSIYYYLYEWELVLHSAIDTIVLMLQKEKLETSKLVIKAL